jgi:hypothetical protein
MAEAGQPETEELRAALRRLGRETARYATWKLDAWQRQISGEAEPAGPADLAVVAGLHGWATGKTNPGWAALRAAWSGSDATTRAAVVGVLLLLAVSAPVLLLLVLLVAVAIAVVLKSRRGMS